MKRQPAVVRNPFHVYEAAGDCIEVTLGPIDDPESERTLTINKDWLPQLIAALTAVKVKK